jgi:hypothetical protein
VTVREEIIIISASMLELLITNMARRLLACGQANICTSTTFCLVNNTMLHGRKMYSFEVYNKMLRDRVVLVGFV